MDNRYFTRHNWRRLAAMLVWLATLPRTVSAQPTPPTILQVDVEDFLFYNYNTYDYTKFATDPSMTRAPMKAFAMHIAVGDIVAVNGKAVKGTLLYRADPMIVLRPNAQPGQAIADTTRGMMDDFNLEFLGLDGTMIGTITASGLWGGAPPVGAPPAATMGNYVITGGTGAYLGVRGQAALAHFSVGNRPDYASVSEDPSKRRVYGAGSARFVLHLLPMSVPEIVTTANGPAVAHSNDFTPVSQTNPAHSGELLSLIATGLGPTKPGVGPGQPFTADPLQLVNSPVEVIVNGFPAEVLYAGGYPGATNAYQVNFRVPNGLAPGMATVQIILGWITGPGIKIAVQ